MTKTLKSVFAVLAIGIAGLAVAQPQRGDVPAKERPVRDEMRARFGQRIARALDLTEQQQATWKQLHEAFREASQPIEEAMKSNRDALRDALDAAQPDAKAVGEIVIAGKGLRTQLETLRENLQKDLRATLTPEQQAKWDALQQMHRPRRERRGGHGGF